MNWTAPPRLSVRWLLIVPSALTILASPIGIGEVGARAATLALASSSGDVAKANQINIRTSDLPKSQQWASSPTPPPQVTLGKTALLCMKASGKTGAKVSPDPFGTVGKSSGDVAADVSSKVFGPNGSYTGLPSTSSEVVFVTTVTQARSDLAAFATAGVRSCEATLVSKVTQLSAGGKITTKVSALTLPHFGDGSGGVHLQFVTTGSTIPGKLYQDVYYYVQGRAEVALTFVNLVSPFSSAWAGSVAKNVMARAKTVTR